MRIAIIGGGTMGSIYASLLSRSTHEVWLVDIWQEHVDAIRRDGLRVDRPGGIETVRVNATINPDEVGSVDVAIVAVKAFQTAAAAVSVGRVLSRDGIGISMQNGFGNGEQLAAVVAASRVAVGVPGHGGALLAPGHIAHRVAAVTPLGWLNQGATEELRELSKTLSKAGLETIVEDDIASLLWSHLAVVAGVNAIAALCRIPNIEVARVPEAARLSELAILEVAAVAHAKGLRLTWEDPVASCRAVYFANGEHHLSSMTQDVLRERPTEIGVLNEAVGVEGRRLGVLTPINDALSLAIRTMERTTARRARL